MLPSTATDVAPPRPLRAFLGRRLEAALARLVALDPETAAALQRLDGHALCIDPAPAPALRLQVSAGRILVGPAGEASLKVRASPGALLGIALGHRRGQPLPPGKLEVSGDAGLARELEQLARRFRPEWDEAFARVFGDFAGPRMARGIAAALAGMRAGAGRLARDGAEFLTEEGRDVVARGELEQFLDEVDRLHEAAERAAARVRRLEAAAQ